MYMVYCFTWDAIMFHEYNTTKTTEKMTEHFIRLDLVIKLRKGHLEKYGDVKRVKRQRVFQLLITYTWKDNQAGMKLNDPKLLTWQSYRVKLLTWHTSLHLAIIITYHWFMIRWLCKKFYTVNSSIFFFLIL